MTAIPASDIDLFAPASLAHPFADYALIRDTAPVVFLPRLNVYALGRFADVQAALRAPDLLASGQGVGFNAVFNAAAGKNVIHSDGEYHRKLRGVIARPLTPASLKPLREGLKSLIAARLASLVDAGPFDAIAQLASFLPLQAISQYVGLPEQGRTRMLEWAAATFNSIGPDLLADDLTALGEARAFIAGMSADAVQRESWASMLFAAVDHGKLTEAEALAALSAYVFPSLDTTILAQAMLLENLGKYPAQLRTLRENPSLISNAVLESVRHSAVVRWFARVALSPYAVEDLTIPQGARVMVMYGAANRDERRFPTPDAFDVERDARDHLAWGTGPHMCAGMHLAKLEMEVLLEALVECGDVEVSVVSSEMGTNSGLYGHRQLQLEIIRRPS